MEVIYALIPGMLFMGVAAVGVLFWAMRHGQFDDLEGDAQRILLDMDECDEPGGSNLLDQAAPSEDQSG